jgi:ATP-binding cassette, subfamily B, bacterial
MHFMHPPRFDEGTRPTKVDRALLKRALTVGLPYRRLILGYLGLTVITTVLGAAPPFIFKKIIDDSIPNKASGQVAWLAVGTVVVATASALIGLWSRWLGARIGEGVIRDLRVKLFTHVQSMPIAFFTRTQTGALMSRVNNDVIGAQQAFTFILRSTVSDVLTVLITVIAMGTLEWRVTVAVLMVSPVLILITRRVGKLQQKVAREQMTMNATLNTRMTERFNVSGALLVKLFGDQSTESKDFDKDASKVAELGVKRAVTGMVTMLALPLIGALATAVVYWWGARGVINDGALTVGTVVAMAALVQRLYGPLADLASTRVDIVTALVSFERIFEVLDAKPSIVDAPSARSIASANLAGSLRFDNVSFRYPAASEVSVASLEAGTGPLSDEASDWILRDVSFTAAPGTVTAIVGPSGAGKSSLASLIPRLYDTTGGTVSIDGHDVRSLTLDSVRGAVGVVTQDAHLFHESIASNLRYAKPNATLAEMEAAARDAHIHDMINSLPEGYETIVGERGYRLSGGEKQRLALARVLLKNPRIVVLDEATAHLDSETESEIQEALASALVGRTAVVIAHRLATIQDADQILVVADGHIAERGTHEELVELGGVYADLYATQFLRGAPVG